MYRPGTPGNVLQRPPIPGLLLMADYCSNILLHCLIKGDHTPIAISAPTIWDVDDLRKHIHDRGQFSALRGSNAKDLIIWKVSTS
jgi:hypothetical protein